MKKTIALAMSAALAGCSTYSTSRYSISADNVVAMRAYKGVSVGTFAAATDYGNAASINCRGVGQINTPDGEPFVQFVRKAFIDELKLAEAFSPSGPISISGRLDAIDFSSVATGEASHGQPRAPGLPEPERTPPHWSIMLTLKSSNGRSLTVSDTFAFAENYVGDIACQQTALAFVPAVQNIIGKVVHSPDFRSLLTP